MDRQSPADLTNLLDPVDIPAFELQYDKSTWTFPGARVSIKVYGDSGCHLDMGQSLKTMQGGMLSLAEDTALVYLAMANYQGQDLAGITSSTDLDAAAISGATAIFNNSLTLALTNSNQGHTHQGFIGEAHNDYVELFGSEEDCVHAVWRENPLVVGEDSLVYSVGANTRSHLIDLPLNEGVAIETDQGYLDPRTGMPFQTDPTCREHSQMFLSSVARAVMLDNKTNDLGDGNLFRMMFGPRELFPIFAEGYDLTKIGDAIAKALPLLKPVFRISHNFGNKTLDEQSGKRFVSMRGIDETADFFVPVLGYVGTHCGMQPRSIERYVN
jgi:hypothetical protein